MLAVLATPSVVSIRRIEPRACAEQACAAVHNIERSIAAAVFFPGAVWAVLGVCKHLLPPAARAEARKSSGVPCALLLAAVVLLQPALILVDHGHFQYNCIALGLAVRSVAGSRRLAPDIS